MLMTWIAFKLQIWSVHAMRGSQTVAFTRTICNTLLYPNIFLLTLINVSITNKNTEIIVSTVKLWVSLYYDTIVK